MCVCVRVFNVTFVFLRCVFWVALMFYLFLFFILLLLFYFRERASAGEGQRERERESEHLEQAQPNVGLDPQTVGS